MSTQPISNVYMKNKDLMIISTHNDRTNKTNFGRIAIKDVLNIVVEVLPDNWYLVSISILVGVESVEVIHKVSPRDYKLISNELL